GGHVDLGILDADTVRRQVVREVPELARGIQQRLGRDAAHVEAGAAQCLLAVLAGEGVDAGGLQAQLRGADRGHIAGRAGADDDDVEFVAHERSFMRRAGARRWSEYGPWRRKSNPKPVASTIVWRQSLVTYFLIAEAAIRGPATCVAD